MKKLVLNPQNIGVIIGHIKNIGRGCKSVKFIRNTNNPGTKLGKLRSDTNYRTHVSLENSFLDVFTNHKNKIGLVISEPSSGAGICLLEGCVFYFIGNKTLIIRVVENSIVSKDAWCKMEFSAEYVEPTNIEMGDYWQELSGGWEYEYGYPDPHKGAKYTGRYRHNSQPDHIYDPRDPRGKKYSLVA